MKIPRHTAGNLSLQRISIAITLVYSNTLSEELQEVLLIFRILYCKFFVNRKSLLFELALSEILHFFTRSLVFYHALWYNKKTLVLFVYLDTFYMGTKHSCNCTKIAHIPFI